MGVDLAFKLLPTKQHFLDSPFYHITHCIFFNISIPGRRNSWTISSSSKAIDEQYIDDEMLKAKREGGVGGRREKRKRMAREIL